MGSVKGHESCKMKLPPLGSVTVNSSIPVRKERKFSHLKRNPSCAALTKSNIRNAFYEIDKVTTHTEIVLGYIWLDETERNGAVCPNVSSK